MARSMESVSKLTFRQDAAMLTSILGWSALKPANLGKSHSDAKVV